VTPDGARDIGVSHVGMFLDIREQHVRFDRRLRESLEVSAASQNLDAAQNLFRCFLSEFWKRGELAVLRDALEILQVLDAELVVNELDFGNAEPRDAHQIQDALGHPFTQSIEVR
jgi:hypothetical protein